MLIRDTTLSEGTMCPVETVVSPGIFMSHMFIDVTCGPSGKSMVRGFVAIGLFTMSMPSILKMDITPVSAIAWLAAIVIAFKYCSKGLPKIWQAVAESNGGECAWNALRGCEQWRIHLR
jgi:hypothetical protein